MKKTSPAYRALCRKFPDGLSADDLLHHLREETGVRLSTPTLRKYVQLGLVERSHRGSVNNRVGSSGFYPPTALVQLVRLRNALKTTDGAVLLHSPALALLQQCESAQAAVDRLMQAVQTRAKETGDAKKRQRIIKATKSGVKAVRAALQGIEREIEAA